MVWRGVNGYPALEGERPSVARSRQNEKRQPRQSFVGMRFLGFVSAFSSTSNPKNEGFRTKIIIVEWQADNHGLQEGRFFLLAILFHHQHHRLSITHPESQLLDYDGRLTV